MSSRVLGLCLLKDRVFPSVFLWPSSVRTYGGTGMLPSSSLFVYMCVCARVHAWVFICVHVSLYV